MITLEKITWDNWNDCIKLKVREDQDNFIATNMYSLAQSYVALLNDELPPMSFVICKDGAVVGFVMAYHDTAEESDNKTYPQGPATAVYLSYEPENEVARKLYASFGFVETGDVVDGEVVARVAL